MGAYRLPHSRVPKPMQTTEFAASEAVQQADTRSAPPPRQEPPSGRSLGEAHRDPERGGSPRGCWASRESVSGRCRAPTQRRQGLHGSKATPRPGQELRATAAVVNRVIRPQNPKSNWRAGCEGGLRTRPVLPSHIPHARAKSLGLSLEHAGTGGPTVGWTRLTGREEIEPHWSLSAERAARKRCVAWQPKSAGCPHVLGPRAGAACRNGITGGAVWTRPCHGHISAALGGSGPRWAGRSSPFTVQVVSANGGVEGYALGAFVIIHEAERLPECSKWINKSHSAECEGSHYNSPRWVSRCRHCGRPRNRSVQTRI